MRKKGISQIVTTILIILLVLAAIIIVWNAVKKTVEKGSEKIFVEEFAYGAELKFSYLEGSPTEATVQVKRSAGGEDITGIKLIFTDTSGKTYYYEDKIVFPGELETKTYNLEVTDLTPNPIDFSTIEKVSVHFFYEVKDEERVTNVLDTERVTTTPGGCSDGETLSCTPPDANPCKKYEKECSGGTWGDCNIEVGPEDDETECYVFGKCYSGECDLVSYWEFENNYQDSAIGNDGTAENGANIVYDAEREGNVLQVGGEGSGDDVNCGNDGSLDITEEITLTAWIYPTAYSGVGYGGGIISKERFSGAVYSIRLPSGQGLKFHAWVGVGATNYINYETAADIPLNQWTFVAATYDKTLTEKNLKLYINDNPAEEFDETRTLITHNEPLFIGKVEDNGLEFTGKIDDAMIFKRALSDAQIQEIYNAQRQIVIPTTGLVSHWEFDEETGGITPDETGGIDGTLQGGASIISDTAKGNVLSLDGVDDYVSLSEPDPSPLDFGNDDDVTISVWVKFTNPDSNKRIYHKMFSNKGIELRTTAEGNGKVELFYGDAVDYVSNPDIINAPIDNGEWHHIVAVIDGDEVRGYLDGVYENNPMDISSVTGTVSGAGDAVIGCSHNHNTEATNYHFEGEIDDMMIYSRALTVQEIQDIHTLQAP